MADISIPGISSKYKSEEIIKKLVEVEKIPLKRMEESVKTLKTQQYVERNSTRSHPLRDRSRTLFGFQNPFNERAATSSDSSILTAIASRDAIEGTYEIQIKQTAGADKYLSRSLPLDQDVPAGNYGFKVGEKEVTFQFRGGKLSAFVDFLNERGKDLIHAGILKDTSNSQVLFIEALKQEKKTS